MGSSSAWIAGSYQSDFARNYAREGLEISDMVAEALEGTLHSAGLAPEDVEAIHVGNAFGQLFTGQGQLGNAWEDGDEVVVDGFFQGCPEPGAAGPGGPEGRMWRFLARTPCRRGCTGGG